MHVTTANKYFTLIHKYFKLLTIFLLMFIVVVSGYVFYQHFFHVPNLSEDPKALAALKNDWQNGEVVALIRHVERCDKSDHPCLLGDGRGVTIIGKDNAIQLGKDFKRLLSLNDAIIYNSPAMRTTQTRQLMFTNQGSEKKWLEDCKTGLLENIFKAKVAHKNLILITHSSCFNALKNNNGRKLLDIKISGKTSYGFTAFIKIFPKRQKAESLGYLYMQDWQTLK